MRLGYSESNKTGKLNILLEVLAAIMLGGAAFYAFISTFGIYYDLRDPFGGSVREGLAGVWNQIADTLGSEKYVLIGKIAGAGTDDGPVSTGLTLTIVLALMIVLAFLIIKSKVRPLLLFFIVPLLAVMLAFGITPPVLPAALLAGAVLISLSVMSAKGKIPLSHIVFPLLIAGIAIGAAFAGDSTVGLAPPRSIQEAGEKIRTGYVRMMYGEDALPRGDFREFTGKDLKERRGSIDDVKNTLGESVNGGSSGATSGENSSGGKAGSGTALTVTMSEPASLYMRSFVGAEYRENQWKPLEDHVYYSMRDKLYWLREQGFSGLTEMSDVSVMGGYGNKDIDVEVEVKDASRKNAVTPYELTAGDTGSEGSSGRNKFTAPEGTKDYGGSHLGTKGFRGRSKYSYKIAGDITSEWTDAVGKFYTSERNEETENFFVNESNYNVMQYESYLGITQKIKMALREELGDPGDTEEEHVEYKKAISDVKKHLSDNYIYSETFKAPKRGEDAALTFLERKTGSDIHFASLATLMFRFYGIPARYVEGYLITPSDISGKTGETSFDVTKRANHAWTEIYVDGFGWVPVETTPDYAGIMKEADMDKGLENMAYNNNDNRNRKKEPPEEEEEEEYDDPGMGAMIRLILILTGMYFGIKLLLALLAIIIEAIAAWIGWRIRFRDKDPKKGVRALYQYSKLKKWNLNGKGEAIGLKASYSESSISEGERKEMREELKKAKNERS